MDNHFIRIYFATNAITQFFDDGIANVLGVETLRHGTNPINWLSIRILGADPAHGGKSSGSSQGQGDYKSGVLKDRFYAFKDRLTILSVDHIFLTTGRKIILLATSIFNPRENLHKFLSTRNFFIHGDKEEWSTLSPKEIIPSCIGFIGALLTPTLKFRFAKIDANRFFDDPTYHGIAYYTAEKIETWRIGFFGTILTGVNLGWFSRVRKKPIRFIYGAVQLTLAASLGALLVQSDMIQTSDIVTTVAIKVLLGI